MGLFLRDSPGGASHPLPRSEDKSRPYGPVIAGPIALSPNGRKVAFVANVPGEVAGSDEVISGRVLGTQVWVQDLAGGRIQRLSHDFSSLPKPMTPGAIVMPAYSYNELAWSPDGRFLAAYQQYGAAIPGGGRTDYQWVVWNVATEKEATDKLPLIGFWRGVTAISPSGDETASLPEDVNNVAYDKLPLRITDTRSKQEVRRIIIPKAPLNASLFWMPSGETLAIAVDTGHGSTGGTLLYLVRGEDGTITRRLELGDAGTHVALSHDGKWIIALDGTDAKLWNPTTAASRTIVGPAGEGIYAVDWVEMPSGSSLG